MSVLHRQIHSDYIEVHHKTVTDCIYCHLQCKCKKKKVSCVLPLQQSNSNRHTLCGEIYECWKSVEIIATYAGHFVQELSLEGLAFHRQQSEETKY